MDPLILFAPDKKKKKEKMMMLLRWKLKTAENETKNLTENKWQGGIKSFTRKYLNTPTSPTWRTFFTPSKNPESTKRAKKHTYSLVTGSVVPYNGKLRLSFKNSAQERQ